MTPLIRSQPDFPLHGALLRGLSVAACLLVTMGQAPALDPLEQARQFYNQQSYDDAIRLAGEARAIPALSAPASIVFGRAHLELFRFSADRGHLVAARDALKTVDASSLNSRDRVELLIALGETLYLDDEHSLDDRFSAAAAEFEVALAHADVLDARSRDLLFDWWAGALDRQAQLGPEGERPTIYARILERAEAELARDLGAPAASYWLAAAARGADDTARAVGAAVAGWVRAGAMGSRGVTLRADLDRLMQQVVLPERARELALGADPRPTLVLLETQWRQFKEKWTN